MKLLFYSITLFPKSFFEYLIDLYISTGFFKLTKSYKITKINLQIAFPDTSLKEINFISKLSYRETLISGFETMIAWGNNCLLYTSPSPRDGLLSRMPSSA